MQGTNVFVDNAKVMAKGQVTIPKDIRKILGVTDGDRISFVVDGDEVRIINSAVFAMRALQAQMSDVSSDNADTEDDIMQLVKEIRSEGNGDESSDRH